MATDPRLFTTSIDELDDRPFGHGFRIPPLQDPNPFASSRRPPALEPVARVPDGPSPNATAKLSTRPKALATAKPLNDDSRPVSRSPRVRRAAPPAPIGPSQRDRAGSDTLTEPERKRPKLDRVQLPRPQPPAKSAARLPPPSFEPVPPVLNELHEPPPSAALLPPITPDQPAWGEGRTQRLAQLRDADKEENMKERRAPSLMRAEEQECEVDRDEGHSATEEPMEEAPSGPSRKQRPHRRVHGRRKWTEEESQAILEGVSIYGKGRWKEILNHKEFNFAPDRSAVDLKDRYRTLKLREQQEIGIKAAVSRAKPRQREEVEKAEDSKPRGATGSPEGKSEAANRGASPSVQTPCIVETIGMETRPAQEKSSEHAQVTDSSTQTRMAFGTSALKSQGPVEKKVEENPFDPMETLDSSAEPSKSMHEACLKRREESGKEKPQSSSSKSTKSSRVPRWTADEDMAMARGYEKYGFRWTTIAQDPELGLGHRSGPQIRDRFRVKFPAHYQESVPLPLPEPWNRSRRKKSVSKQTSFEASGVANATTNEKTEKPPRPLIFVMHDGKKRPTASTARAQAPKERKTLVPSAPRTYRSPYKRLPARPKSPLVRSARPPDSPPTSPKAMPRRTGPGKPTKHSQAPPTTMPPPSPESSAEAPPTGLPDAPDLNNGRQLDIMQLLNHRGPPTTALSVGAEPEAVVRHLDIMGLLNDDSPVDAPTAFQDSAEPEAVRHMDIMGLLNNDHIVAASAGAGHGTVGADALAAVTGNAISGAPDGSRNRLPPVKSTLDDWSVTLPPLQWEDFASKPMLDFD